MNTTAAQQYEVLVLGAGYAGLSAAIQLAARTRKRGNLRVTVVNPHDTFTERVRLHMTATGQQTSEMNIPELLDGTGAGFVHGWVTAVDAEAKTVRIDDDRVLHYDTWSTAWAASRTPSPSPARTTTPTPSTARRTPRSSPTG